jgi:hypothetical protein
VQTGYTHQELEKLLADTMAAIAELDPQSLRNSGLLPFSTSKAAPHGLSQLAGQRRRESESA